MHPSSAERTACLECDLVVQVGNLGFHQSACCPRCGNVLASASEQGLTVSLAFALAAAVLLVLANAFPFMQLRAEGLEQVMTLPGTALELYRSDYSVLAALVIGPIIGVPALMLATLLALLVPIHRGRSAPWLVPAGRFLFILSPWSMVEVFVIGVLVSLVKIGGMATVVLGISFWAYVVFAVCFIASLSRLDRLELWSQIEACNP